MIAGNNEYSVTDCTAIILAAGRSSRLGNPKQLLTYQGKTLLQHTIDAARQSMVRSIVLVLGSNMELLIKATDTSDLHIVKNENWQDGMGSSISTGINALGRIIPLPDAAILMVCDQPFITATLLDDLLFVQKATNKPIVASKYEDTIGIPALFHKKFFQQLIALEGDTGAKKLMNQYTYLLDTVPFPLGSIDIDTLEDYESLSK